MSRRYNVPNYVVCAHCSNELYGDESVYIHDGANLCEECAAEEMGCEPSEVRDLVLSGEVDAFPTTAANIIEDMVCAHEDFEYDLARQERDLADAMAVFAM